MMLQFVLVCFLLGVIQTCRGDVSHLPPEVLARHRALEEARLHEEDNTQPPPPKPYHFSYAAGRFPGHLDRMHSEISDGSGTVKGSYSYVDPRHEIRTVEYVADEHGFHPALSHPAPAETVSVARARERHYLLYNKIAQDHANHPYPEPYAPAQPHDTEAVEHAKARHFTLFEKIATEHAQIAAERAAEQEALGLHEPNELNEETHHRH